MFNKKFKKADGTYNEDSVRVLLYTKGIIDYQYEIYEVPDIDTAEVFNKVFFADKFKYIRIGFYKSGNDNIILKTKSFLKFDHARISQHSDIGDFMSGKYSINVYKILESDEYYFQLSDNILSNAYTTHDITR